MSLFSPLARRASLLFGLLLGGSALLVPAAAVAAASCTPAGTTGLTAAVVATAGQTITGTVDATGCNIGIYIGHDAAGAVVDGAVVSGASDQGILVQDSAGVTIRNSTVTHNGLHRTKALPEDKAIQLVGTRGSLVIGNTVTDNFADGGIAINDDGPLNPGGLAPGMLLPGIGNRIIGNTISGNLNGCGIVISAYNAGPSAGVRDNLVSGNTVTGTPGVFPPVVGGIVVAADTPGSLALNNVVEQNTITGNGLPGVIVHSNAPGDIVSGTVVRWNTLSANDWLMSEGPSKPAGIVVIGEVEPVWDTFVEGNHITNEVYGVWSSHAVRIFTNDFGLNEASIPVYAVR